MKQSAVDLAIENLAEEQDITIEQARNQFVKESDHVLELDKVTQDHNWIDRGLKFTCESPSHPYHEAWKRRSAV